MFFFIVLAPSLSYSAVRIYSHFLVIRTSIPVYNDINPGLQLHRSWHISHQTWFTMTSIQVYNDIDLGLHWFTMTSILVYNDIDLGIIISHQTWFTTTSILVYNDIDLGIYHIKLGLQ